MTKVKLLSDYLDLEPFAKEVGRHPRSVRRWMSEPDGLPYTRLGNRLLIHIPTAQAWLLDRLQKPNPRRRKRATEQDGNVAAVS